MLPAVETVLACVALLVAVEASYRAWQRREAERRARRMFDGNTNKGRDGC